MTARSEPLVLPPRLGLGVLLSLATLIATVGVMVLPATRTAIDGLDEDWWAFTVDAETWLLVSLAEFLAFVGGAWVTAPLRVGFALWFGWARRWAHLATWLGTVLAAEVGTRTLKQAVDRERPELALEATSTASFPSGHTSATVSLIVALLLLFAGLNRKRRRWAAAGVAAIVLMAMSRTYLRVHWLSDVVAGTVLGITAALAAAYVTKVVVGLDGPRRRPGPRSPGPGPRPGPRSGGQDLGRWRSRHHLADDRVRRSQMGRSVEWECGRHFGWQGLVGVAP